MSLEKHAYADQIAEGTMWRFASNSNPVVDFTAVPELCMSFALQILAQAQRTRPELCKVFVEQTIPALLGRAQDTHNPHGDTAKDFGLGAPTGDDEYSRLKAQKVAIEQHKSDRLDLMAMTLSLPGVTYVGSGYAIFDVRKFRIGDLPGGFNWVDFLRLDDDRRQEIKAKMDDTNRYQVGHFMMDAVPTISQPGVPRVCQCELCRPKIKSATEMAKELLGVPNGLQFIAKRLEAAINQLLVVPRVPSPFAEPVRVQGPPVIWHPQTEEIPDEQIFANLFLAFTRTEVVIQSWAIPGLVHVEAAKDEVTADVTFILWADVYYWFDSGPGLPEAA